MEKKQGRERTRRYSVTLGESLVSRLKAIAQLEGLSVSELICRIVDGEVGKWIEANREKTVIDFMNELSKK